MAPIERILPARRGGAALPPDAGGTVIAPFQFVLDGTESLSVNVVHTTGPLGITLLLRMQRPNGTIHVGSHTLKTAASGSTTKYFSPGAGALLNVSVFSNGSTGFGVLWGECFATVGLTLGEGAAAQKIGTLVQSYVTQGFAANWPGTPFRPSVEGPGALTHRAFNSGALGASATIQGQSPETYRLSVLSFTLATSGVAGARRALVQLGNGATVVYSAWSPVVQPAASGWVYECVCDGVDRDTSVIGLVQIALPRYQFKPQDNITIAVGGMDPGDQVTAPMVYGERWIDPF